MSGPDHFSSDSPKEFNIYVNKIRNVEKILGSDRKRVQKEELEMKKISRKGIYYGIDQVKGKKINLKNLYLKRPYTNQSIFEIKKLLNKKLNKNIFKNHMLNKNDFKK